MKTRYPTLAAARADGWLTTGDAKRVAQEADQIVTDHNGRNFGYQLWHIREDGRHKLPTHSLTLTEEKNALGKPGSVVTAIRRENLTAALERVA
jgi:hypothetical protein